MYKTEKHEFFFLSFLEIFNIFEQNGGGVAVRLTGFEAYSGFENSLHLSMAKKLAHLICNNSVK